MLNSLIDNARQWCQGRNPWVRLPLIFVFAYWGLRYWTSGDYSCILSPLTLGIHELGHLIFTPLGMTWGILGGTLTQVLAPIYGVFNFLKQNDYFSAALSLGWLSTSLFEAARYIGDARSMALPLVSAFGNQDPIHDWNWLLLHWDLLNYDILFGTIVRWGALIVLVIGVMTGLWLCLQMMAGEKGNP